MAVDQSRNDATIDKLPWPRNVVWLRLIATNGGTMLIPVALDPQALSVARSATEAVVTWNQVLEGRLFHLLPLSKESEKAIELAQSSVETPWPSRETHTVDNRFISDLQIAVRWCKPDQYLTAWLKL